MGYVFAVVLAALPAERHVGVTAAVSPFSAGVLVDVDAKHVYAFVRGGAGWFPDPLGGETFLAGTVSAGLGGTLRLNENWRLQIFAEGTYLWARHDELKDAAVGVGVGFAYTRRSGFTLEIKPPIFTFGITRGHDRWNLADGFWVSLFAGVPSVTLGYRF
jgi:hypothetical protein